MSGEACSGDLCFSSERLLKLLRDFLREEQVPAALALMAALADRQWTDIDEGWELLHAHAQSSVSWRMKDLEQLLSEGPGGYSLGAALAGAAVRELRLDVYTIAASGGDSPEWDEVPQKELRTYAEQALSLVLPHATLDLMGMSDSNRIRFFFRLIKDVIPLAVPDPDERWSWLARHFFRPALRQGIGALSRETIGSLGEALME